jgi:hypothetical protein
VGAVFPIFHLPEGIAINPDNIEHLRRAAEFGMSQAADHIPGKECIIVSLIVRVISQVRSVPRRDDQDKRVNVNHACLRIDLSDGPNRRDVGSAQRKAQLPPLLIRPTEGSRPGPLTTHKGEEGDLVDWREEVRTSYSLSYILRCRTGIGCESFRKFRSKWIDIIRVAVVAQVPDRQDLVPVHRLDERIKP